MTTLVLVRHAESQMQGRYVGRSDPPLSDHGRMQAEALSRRLAGVPLAAIYCSPLVRALSTARSIARPHGLPVQVAVGLSELDFGHWEGLSYQEIAALDAGLLADWLAEPVAAAPPGGETLMALSRRALSAAETIRTRHRSDETVAVVSHAGPLRAIICDALGLAVGEHWRVAQDVAGVSVLRWRGEQAVLLRLNCACHLDEVEALQRAECREA